MTDQIAAASSSPSPTLKDQLSVVTTPELYPYLQRVSLREPDLVRKYREDLIRSHPKCYMSSSPDESQFLAFLLEIIQAKKVIEVGVFLGYTTLVMGLTLPDDGKIVALDVSEEFTAIGKKVWEEAGVAHKIDLRIAPAVESLQRLLEDGQAGTFDFVYVDADKSNYDNYYELCLQLLRVGGVMAVDNVLWHGKVLNPQADDKDTQALSTLNLKIHKDQRVTITMLPVADGVTLCRKRAV